MKRIISILIVLSMVLLAGCGRGEKTKLNAKNSLDVREKVEQLAVNAYNFFVRFQGKGGFDNAEKFKECYQDEELNEEFFVLRYTLLQTEGQSLQEIRIISDLSGLFYEYERANTLIESGKEFSKEPLEKCLAELGDRLE